MALDCSMAGTIRLQMEAATITPAAKPVKARCTPRFRSFFRKNTQAAPADVPIKGIRSPMISVFIFYRTTPVYNEDAHRTDVRIRDPARSENEDVRHN